MIEIIIKIEIFFGKTAGFIGFERARIGGKKKVNAFWEGLLILIKMIKMFFLK